MPYMQVYFKNPINTEFIITALHFKKEAIQCKKIAIQKANIEAVSSFKTLVLTYQTIQCCNPEDHISILKVEAVCSFETLVPTCETIQRIYIS
jgi:hypothetical protein